VGSELAFNIPPVDFEISFVDEVACDIPLIDFEVSFAIKVAFHVVPLAVPCIVDGGVLLPGIMTQNEGRLELGEVLLLERRRSVLLERL